MTVAPRPIITAEECLKSIESSGICTAQDAYLFCEPGSEYGRRGDVVRPDTFAEVEHGITPSPEGRFGNFQNWIQAARDMCALASLNDREKTILMVEDDAMFAPNLMPVLERDLWPSPRCGCVSLYCPNMTHYKQQFSGLNLTRIEAPGIIGRSGNLVGALALLFPVEVLRQLVYHPSVATWPGSHAQADRPDTKPWERKAVDTWVGRTLVQMGYTIWHYSPSMIMHYEPERGKSNSTMGHSAASKSRVRQARSFVGMKPRDLTKVFQKRTEKYDVTPIDLQSAGPVHGRRSVEVPSGDHGECTVSQPASTDRSELQSHDSAGGI